MTIRDWIAATWAAWAPTVEPGHVELGPIIILTREELANIVREHHDHGVIAERNGDGRLWRDYQVQEYTA